MKPLTRPPSKLLAPSHGWLYLFALLAAGSISAITWNVVPSAQRASPSGVVCSLHDLLRLASEKFRDVSVLRANLLCAEQLSARNPEDVVASEALVKSWAQHVKAETARHLYRYQQHPAEYENSPGFFRMLMLAVVLAEDYHIHYDPSRVGSPGTAEDHDGFFSDPDSVFLTGLLGPDRKGTCSSMPVLYVALGRELGYPLSLVSTKGHLFVRWEGDGERFNIEATGHGLNRFDDDYYRHWPFEITSEEEQAEGYLRSMSRAEEVAAFLSIRGMCFSEAGKMQQAAEAFEAATRLSPYCASYKRMLASLQNALAQNVHKQPSF